MNLGLKTTHLYLCIKINDGFRVQNILVHLYGILILMFSRKINPFIFERKMPPAISFKGIALLSIISILGAAQITFIVKVLNYLHS